MPLLFGILVSALIIFAIFAVAIGHGGSMTQFKPDWPGRPLPEDRTVRAHDVADAQFSLAFRGYRMAEVDEALDRLAVEIAERDEQIQRLTGQPFEYVPPAPPVTPAADTVDSIASGSMAPGSTAPDSAEPADVEPVESVVAEYPVAPEYPVVAESPVAPEPLAEPVVTQHPLDSGGPATQPIPPVIEPGVER
ncbi:MAG TPA: DivIVA domain-containing protein [Acidothermaceae bacterium]|nr:DivIVA domain-containing protein [Acidothermaceae bacterium]